MNRIIFWPDEDISYLPASDSRYIHIINVLRAQEGSLIKVGRIQDKSGIAKIVSINKKRLTMIHCLGDEDPGSLYPVHILLGHPRPAVLYRIIRDLSSIGVASISVVPGVLCEKSYLQTSFWKEQRYKQALLDGAMQAGVCTIPSCRLFESLESMLKANRRNAKSICFEQSADPILTFSSNPNEYCLAIGPERGWTEREHKTFSEYGFTFATLGPRVLRTETACISVAVHAVRSMTNRI